MSEATEAYFLIQTNVGAEKRVSAQVCSELPGSAVELVAGSYDLIVKVLVRGDPHEIQKKLYQIPGVSCVVVCQICPKVAG